MSRCILRIKVDGRIWKYSQIFEQYLLIKEGHMGPSSAGIRGECWRGLPAPALTNKRARFYFTELGWHKVGQHVYAEAKRRGHVVSVLRRAEPKASQVVYRDEWQVAILPDQPKPKGTEGGGTL